MDWGMESADFLQKPPGSLCLEGSVEERPRGNLGKLKTGRIA